MPGKKKTSFRPISDFLAERQNELDEIAAKRQLELDQIEAKRQLDLVLERERISSPEYQREKEQEQFKQSGYYRDVPRMGIKTELPQGINVEAMEFALLFLVNQPECIGKPDFRAEFDAFFIQYVMKKYLYLETAMPWTLPVIRAWYEKWRITLGDKPWRNSTWRFLDVVTFERCLKALCHVGFLERKLRCTCSWLIDSDFLAKYEAPVFEKFGSAERRRKEIEEFDDYF